MTFVEQNGVVQASTSVTRLFDATAFGKLDAGFPTTVVIRVEVMPYASSTVQREIILVREALYDMWDEKYAITTTSAGGKASYEVTYRAEALRLLTDLRGIAVGTAAQLPAGQWFVLRISASLNPVSAKAVREAQGWLSTGSGGGMDRGGTLFGSFVSVFVRPDVAAADRYMVTYSQPFYRVATP